MARSYSEYLSDYGYDQDYEPSYSSYQPAPDYSDYGRTYSSYDQPAYDGYDPYQDPGYTYDQQPQQYEYSPPPQPVASYQAEPAQPSYDYQAQAEPYQDPGYTLDQGYQPQRYAPQQAPADYVTMPGETTPYNPSTGDYWEQPARTPNPANAWLAPTVNRSRDPQQPAYSPPPASVEPSGGPVNTDPLSAGMVGATEIDPVVNQAARVAATQEQRLTDYDRYNSDLSRFDRPLQDSAFAYTPPPEPAATLPDYGPSLFDRAGGWLGDRRNELGVYTDTLGQNVQGSINDAGTRGDVLTDMLSAEASQYVVDNTDAYDALVGQHDVGLAIDELAGPTMERELGELRTGAQAVWGEVPEGLRGPAEFVGGKAMDAATLAGEWNTDRVGEQVYRYHEFREDPGFYVPGFLVDRGINQTSKDEIRSAYEQGYDGYTGGQAVYQFLQDQESPGAIGGFTLEAAYDPTTWPSLLIPGLQPVKAGTAALRAANTGSRSARLLDRTVGAVARGVEVADAATSLPFSLPGIGRSAASRVGRNAIGDVASEADVIPVTPGAQPWRWGDPLPDRPITPAPPPPSEPVPAPPNVGQRQTTRPVTDQPNPETRMAERVDDIGGSDPAGDVVLVSDNSGRYWLENPDTGSDLYGSFDTYAEAYDQLGNATRQVRLDRASRTTTPTNVAGGATTPPANVVPLRTREALTATEQPITGGGPIVDRNGVPLRTREALATAERDVAGGLPPEAVDPSLIRRTVTPTGEPAIDPEIGRIPTAGEEAFPRTTEGTMPPPPASRLGTPSSPLREDAAEIARLRRAAETRAPVELPQVATAPGTMPAPPLSRLGEAPAATASPAQTPELQRPPTRTNPRGEALSDADWTPPPTRIRADEATPGPNVPFRVRSGEGTGGRYWRINGQPANAPENIVKRDRMLSEMQSPSMTTQRYDTPEARSWRAVMFEQEAPDGGRVLEAAPSQNQGYRTWLETVAPLVRKEPPLWNGRQGIFARDKVNRHAVADVQKVAGGQSVDSVIRQRFPATGRSSVVGIRFDPTAAPAEWHEATRGIRDSGVLQVGARRTEDEETNAEGIAWVDNAIRQVRELPGELQASTPDTIGSIASGALAGYEQVQTGVENRIARWLYDEAIQARDDPNFRSSSEWIGEQGDLIRSVHENGYTPESGEFAGQHLTGDRAVWELLILQQPGWVQFAAEVGLDPGNLVPGLGAGGKAITRADNLPDLIKGAGALLAAPDTAFNLLGDATVGTIKTVGRGIGKIPIVGTPLNWLLDASKRTKATNDAADLTNAVNEIVSARQAPFGAPISSDAAKATLARTFSNPKHLLAGQTWGQAWDDFTTAARTAQTEYNRLKAKPSPTAADTRTMNALQSEWGGYGADLSKADPQDLAAIRTAIEVSLDGGANPNRPRGLWDLLTNGLMSDGLLHTPFGLSWSYAARNLMSNGALNVMKRTGLPLPLLNVKTIRAVIGEANPAAMLARGDFDDLVHVQTARRLGIGVPQQIGKNASNFESAGASSAFTQLMQRLGLNKLVRTEAGKARAFNPTEKAKAINEGLEAAQRGVSWNAAVQQEMAGQANLLRTHVTETIRRGRLAIDPADLKATLDALPNLSSSNDVAVAMRDLALLNKLTPAAAESFARNIGTRQANLVRQASETALRRTEQIFIGYYPRNIDEMVGKAIPFHYWPSRAILSVADAAIRTPAIVAAYMDVYHNGGMERLTQSDNPYVAGMARIAGSVFGFGLFTSGDFINPVAQVLRDRGVEFIPPGETGAGTIQREAEKYGVRANYILDSLLNMAGIQGDTFTPQVPRKDVPIFLGAIDFALTQLGGRPHEPLVAQWLSDLREDVTIRLNEMGLPIAIIESGSETGYIEDRIASLIREQHPELSDAEWDAAVREQWGNPLWDEAARANAGVSFGTRLNNALNPFPLIARIEGRDEDVILAKEGRDTPEGERTPEQEQAIANRDIATRSPEAKAWNDTVDGYHQIGSPRQTYLNEAMNAIRYADETMARPIVVDGETYTRQRLADMTPSERSSVAYAWLRSQPNDAAAEYDTFQTERAAYRTDHPGVQGLYSLADEHPLGRAGFIDELRTRSPRYDAYINDLSAEPGTVEWEQKALNSSGYQMAVGNEWSVYDRDLAGDPTVASELATVEQTRQEEQAARDAEFEQYAEDERFGVTEQVRYFTEDVGERVAFIESWGMSEADTAYAVDLFLNNTYGLTDENLPYWLYDPLRDQFGGDYVYPKFFDNEYKGKARGYLQAKAQDPDLTMEEFLTDYKAERKRERESFDIERDLILPGYR